MKKSEISTDLQGKHSPPFGLLLVVSMFCFFLIINLPDQTLILLGNLPECSNDISGFRRLICYEGDAWVRVFFLFCFLFFAIGFLLFFIKLHIFDYENYKERRNRLMLSGRWKEGVIVSFVFLMVSLYDMIYGKDVGFNIYGFSMIKNKEVFFLIFGFWYSIFAPLLAVLLTLEIRLFLRSCKK